MKCRRERHVAHHCGPGVCLRGPRAGRCCLEHDLRRRRRRRQVQRGPGRWFLPHAHRPGHDGEPDGRVLGPGESDDDRRPGVSRPLDPERDAPWHRGHLRGLSAQGARARRHAERHPALRGLRREGRTALPVRPQDHLSQRGQPASLPPATVRRRRQRDLRLRAGAGDGRLLRRGEGGRSQHQRHRLRPLTARQRRLRRSQQCVALADPLSRRGGGGVPRKRTEQADRRRALDPLLPEREHRRSIGGLRLAEGRLRQLRPHQAGLVGRVPRHRAAPLP